MMTVSGHLGIDVSKDKLDVSVAWDNHHRAKRFQNSAAGAQALCEWLQRLGLERVHACLEATGRYGDVIALVLHEGGHGVSVVNPVQVKNFAKARLSRNKTDKVDAETIRVFCEKMTPPLWNPPPAPLRRLRDLVRLRENLRDDLQAWRNRQSSGTPEATVQIMVERMIGHLEDQLAAIDAEIEKTADDDEELTAKRDLLRSIPGIGPVAAATILAELPDVKDLGQARRAVAYVGLNPSLRQSGTSVNAPARISRIGHAGLRTALYMPALAAMRHNPLVAALCKRLKEAGRLKPKQIVVAAMRKLLQLCFGVLKTGQPFNPSWTSKTCDRPITAT